MTRMQKRQNKRDDFCAVCALILVALLFLFVARLEAKWDNEVHETEQRKEEIAATRVSSMPEAEIEEWHRFCEVYRSECPLSDDEQMLLFDACEEFGIDYFLMLGIIQKETQFRNVTGDSGDSEGYCQVQRKWWGDLMADIGTDDLMNPEDNFRTSCAILSQLFAKYGCGNLTDVLTAYNSGHGGESDYATDVIYFQEQWYGTEESMR